MNTSRSLVQAVEPYNSSIDMQSSHRALPEGHLTTSRPGSRATELFQEHVTTSRPCSRATQLFQEHINRGHVTISRLGSCAIEINRGHVPTSRLGSCAIEINRGHVPTSRLGSCAIEINRGHVPTSRLGSCAIEINHEHVPTSRLGSCAIEIYHEHVPTSRLGSCAIEINRGHVPTSRLGSCSIQINRGHVAERIQGEPSSTDKMGNRQAVLLDQLLTIKPQKCFSFHARFLSHCTAWTWTCVSSLMYLVLAFLLRERYMHELTHQCWSNIRDTIHMYSTYGNEIIPLMFVIMAGRGYAIAITTCFLDEDVLSLVAAPFQFSRAKRSKQLKTRSMVDLCSPSNKVFKMQDSKNAPSTQSSIDTGTITCEYGKNITHGVSKLHVITPDTKKMH
ncbi:hypothetical protein MAR_027343 [Mya arenaria]|uniref:Uncharacterized protein n=1 Tax=Mya arenaria TaxID=6604 RepID=A0ABY7EXB0_MYAAR|nr:hypothetical protein MAR_027343 [Mya arenaria]